MLTHEQGAMMIKKSQLHGTEASYLQQSVVWFSRKGQA